MVLLEILYLSSLLSSFSLMKPSIPRSIERFLTMSKAVTLTHPIHFKLVRVTQSILRWLPFKNFRSNIGDIYKVIGRETG